MTDYSQAIEYLNSFINYEKKKTFNYSELRLKRVEALLKLLGNPHRKVKAIHIAGTKGKGSTSIFIANILKAAGYKTGLYISPHLHDFRERISINGRLISREDLVKAVKVIKAAIDKYRESSDEEPTFFEVYTILGFYYFYCQQVDFMVIETGIGGRLDATNVIKPLVSVITPISYEHKDKLGKTLTKIAGEKAGIIKRKAVTISARQSAVARKVIEKKAKELKSRLFIVGRDVTFEEIASRKNRQFFTIKGLKRTYTKLRTFLLGRHQLMNAACSIAAIEALGYYGIDIEPGPVHEGISRARWPGRLEVLSRKPTIIVDGAQNKASAKVLRDAVLKLFKYEKLILILGVSQDKDIKSIASVLQRISDRIILTQAYHPRAASVYYLEKFITADKPVHLIDSVEEAVTYARRKAKESDLILITGSLFIVAQAKTALRMLKND